MKTPQRGKSTWACLAYYIADFANFEKQRDSLSSPIQSLRDPIEVLGFGVDPIFCHAPKESNVLERDSTLQKKKKERKETKRPHHAHFSLQNCVPKIAFLCFHFTSLICLVRERERWCLGSMDEKRYKGRHGYIKGAKKLIM